MTPAGASTSLTFRINGMATTTILYGVVRSVFSKVGAFYTLELNSEKNKNGPNLETLAGFISYGNSKFPKDVIVSVSWPPTSTSLGTLRTLSS